LVRRAGVDRIIKRLVVALAAAGRVGGVGAKGVGRGHVRLRRVGARERLEQPAAVSGSDARNAHHHHAE
jgi:hypothetical protein